MSDPSQPYRIGRLLGRGAVASVHEVFDSEGQRFAGKFLHASRDGDEVAVTRFAQEAALLRGLDHPNLVRVDGPAQGEGEAGERRAFVRMELVDGVGLDVVIAREAPLPESRVIEFGRQLAAGLAYAHGHGIVHRDLKPANVLVAELDTGPGVLKIADFGMARASSLSGIDADALTILGTPDYMAPESLDPIAVDARADLYALGCMLYEMLTGEVPYSAATPFGTLARHRDDPVPTLADAISPELRSLVEALMAKSPADRPPSAGVVAERLATLARAALDPNPQALALVPSVAGSRCAGCGHALLEHLAMCLNCGLSAVTVERGEHCVIITGPGEVGDKLDSAMRDRLREWLASNPQIGLAAAKALESKIPRLPVVFVSSVAERSAQAIVTSLAALGFASEAHAGSSLKHPMVRSKAGKLVGRVGLIALTSMGGIWQTGVAAPVILGVGALAAMIGMSIHSAKAVTRSVGAAPDVLSPGLRTAFDRVEQIAPALPEARHRHALRAVVRQSLDLRKQLGPDQVDEELAGAVTLASATTASLARIDADLRSRDLNDGAPETRELLHQRDHLAGRMAELSGSLETLRIRARSGRGPVETDESLDDLRARVEALEEVQAL
ncbi:Serine/threonine-protein kinase PknB [Enhygromyxa salina]|uniref:Serine/threonine-protein kinase PknB n=1 Tax=Enhygromyxa salina TaxID=215803 RepID=A0A2S9YBS3_9BACT|nr:serine/threonine-protein kinase [Enhygromyxa salina]PRQ02466.1 Serine/threonine-protein kinase PknB [Enhygromyxa salina]